MCAYSYTPLVMSQDVMFWSSTVMENRRQLWQKHQPKVWVMLVGKDLGFSTQPINMTEAVTRR
jgi:hypothetical protein